MDHVFTISHWYHTGQNATNVLPTENDVRSFVRQGSVDEVVGIEWHSAEDGRAFLKGIADVAFEVMESSDHVVAIIHSKAFQKKTEKQEEEFRKLMDTMKEALDAVALHDNEQAARLTAKVYVHLKSAPVGYQRLFDGLLHKYTGVYHSRSRRPNDPQ